jgi:nitrate reductase delta subunit
MARSYRALGALLGYPTVELQAATEEIAGVLAQEGLVAAPQRAAIDRLLAELATEDIYALQESYFTLFDRSRTLSLHLFEHVHGESRDRGQAMADLIAHYREHGYEPTATELPDYLPLFLEFLSVLPAQQAQALLVEPAGILQTIAERLVLRRSAYAAVFQALGAIAKAPPVQLADTEIEDPNDLEALDAAWEEAAVQFGPGEQLDDCGVDRLRSRLRAATRDASASTSA